MLLLLVVLVVVLPGIILHTLILYSAIVRGRNPLAWGLLALVLGPLALIVAVLPTRETLELGQREWHPMLRAVLAESFFVFCAGGLAVFLSGFIAKTAVDAQHSVAQLHQQQAEQERYEQRKSPLRQRPVEQETPEPKAATAVQHRVAQLREQQAQQEAAEQRAASLRAEEAEKQAGQQRVAALRARVGSGGSREGSSASGSSTGSPVSVGAGGQSGIPLRIYRVEVQARLMDAWNMPPQSQNLHVEVFLLIDRAGTVKQSRFVQGSGNALFDESVRQALKQAQPLPALPEDYTAPSVQVTLHFRGRS